MTTSSHHNRPRTLMCWRYTVAIAASLAVLCACTDKSDNSADRSPDHKAPSAASPSPAHPASSPPPNAEKSAVLASYNAMWVEQMKAYRKADASGTDLEKYATLDALAKVRIDLAKMKQRGTVIRGAMGHQVTVTKLDLSPKTPTAAMTDCVDLSNWQTWDTKANKPIPLPSAQPMRYLAQVKAERWDGGRWMITDFITKGSQPCGG
ncbi:hypothetical protein DWB77_00083 [Streptomyces hundungensis]|uniref:Secreted protein/lipoprotein n=1 Tax=Streptomyces hundungensis TaxID=1077946 RepID=A0A387H2U3_9ACTN|nr:hypothetical protein [Streptomyces hundungensis]AYG77976.1 hypothetical protein DWB77_00083 [Streptomyces hundungensis]